MWFLCLCALPLNKQLKQYCRCDEGCVVVHTVEEERFKHGNKYLIVLFVQKRVTA